MRHYQKTFRLNEMTRVFQNSLLQAKTRYQLLATVIVNIITFGHGVGVGWLSPTLTRIQAPDSPLDFAVNIDEISWLGSMIGLGNLAGNLAIAFLLERTGRKFCIYLLAGPYACLWILVYCASNVGYLYTARFLCGFTGGALYIVVPIFISEVADPSIRGALSSVMMMYFNFGVLAGYTMSTYLPYHVVPIVGIMLPIAYFFASLMLPETAPYLLKRSQLNAAEKSFRYYTNQQGGVTSKAQFEDLRSAVLLQQSQSTSHLSYKDLITKPALKAFGAAAVLCAGLELSNVYSFINYMSDIFTSSGSLLDVNTCTIIIGVVQIIGVYTSTIFVDIVGRRFLMLISTLGVGIGCIAFGCFTYFAEHYDLSQFNWLPLALMILIIYFANIGINSLFCLVMVELFPSKIRSLATSMSLIWMSLLIFCTLKLFPYLMHNWGISITMWFSATWSLLTFIYFLLFLPETKGKSMIED
ncbi:facilitated trehalose transporter Tret1-like [Drosophila pseudoobscura]|uniref:Facilitated trehalose transporter Tret1-like n=1 Tax=Drosophila pseudoobscura pseudoobscura TaxID=46245 RepID=A0A6I8V8R2_DROPS|nr:facilitated trehalose transporter Tret1 [Drosophila pseudoobscura]XP_015036172.2 facilitated trehalose transporter Tret1 [Drosophila pseudoobscura]